MSQHSRRAPIPWSPPRIMTEKLIICENTHKGIIPECIIPLLIIYCEPISGVYVPAASRDHLRDWFFIHRWQHNLQSKFHKRELGLTYCIFSLHRQVPLMGCCGLCKIKWKQTDDISFDFLFKISTTLITSSLFYALEAF